ncbi:MAG: hypothetical protein CV088_22425 [Nitrospira sp. LK70]|nr:hypothetical protein [Nitrospira sp. LK70]
MTAASTSDESNRSKPPLWSIGLAVVIILVAPLVLYSLASTGPIRDGDTVFSEGEQHVQIRHTATEQSGKADDTCLLDPNSPLIVLHSPIEQADGSIIAQVQGNRVGAWPCCPVHAKVPLKSHQICQKPAVFGAVPDRLTNWFSRLR